MASTSMASNDPVQLAAVSAGHARLLPLIGLPEVRKRVNFNEIPSVVYSNCSQVQPPAEKPVGTVRRFVRRVKRTLARIPKDRAAPPETKRVVPRSPVLSPKIGLSRKRTLAACDQYDSDNWSQQDTSQITAELLDIFEQMTLNMKRKKPRLGNSSQEQLESI